MTKLQYENGASDVHARDSFFDSFFARHFVSGKGNDFPQPCTAQFQATEQLSLLMWHTELPNEIFASTKGCTQRVRLLLMTEHGRS